MPKLRRVRLSSIGYDSARFDDVILDFTDRDGHPTNSIVWLRNGGGKTSLLSLLFAGLRTNKRDFLGQRAEEKVRRLSDYVGRHDHGVVICEWELDAEQGLFDDLRPRYLSGVFYQRKEGDGTNGEAEVERLFFATLVSSKTDALTLEGLPLFAEEGNEKRRKTLHGFRRSLRQLDHDFPDHGVFIEDKTQGRFEEELASRGIDPEVFFYQIRMNEREGGVSERFSFAEDEDFVDFLLEMTFDQRHARQVREQLSTFRQEIFERNEQLRPELECCRGLVSRLQKLSGLARERERVFRESAAAHAALHGLLGWTASWIANRDAEAKELKLQIADSETSADQALDAANRAHRLGAVHQRQAQRLRRDEVRIDYDAIEREYRNAKRTREIWQAAIPLARVWNARHEAKQLREQLERKLREFAPQLSLVRTSATRLANALEQAAITTREEATTLGALADRLRTQAVEARDQAATAGESAASDELQVRNLTASLDKADVELNLLREQGILQAGEVTVADARSRIVRAVQEAERSIVATTQAREDFGRQHAEARRRHDTAAQERVQQTSELAVLKDLGARADAQRSALERDAALLRLLQTDSVDVDVACTMAIAKAADELRRVIDEILRIRVESAEDERAIHALEESHLLPPSQDVELYVSWLRDRQMRCWSGWEYLAANVEAPRQRSLISQLPYLATGIVVRNADYDRVVELCNDDDPEDRRPRLRAPLVIAPADALADGIDVLWTVVGPTSDAHFDKKAAAAELNALLQGRSSRTHTLDKHQDWQEALTSLKSSLQQFHADYPRGWFSEQRQKMEVARSRLDETDRLLKQLDDQLAELQADIDRSGTELQSFKLSLVELGRHRDRLDQYERGYGSHLEEWRRERALARDRAAKSRKQQEELRSRAQEWETKSTESRLQGQSAHARGAQWDGELEKLKYVDETARQPAAGPLEELRSQYESHLADYEEKVNADTLSQLAAAHDRDADKEEREFERILARLGGLESGVVEASLKELPIGSTAQQQYEVSDASLADAFQRMGSLGNRLKAAEADYSKADQECARLATEGPLPELVDIESSEEHLAKAVAYWKERDEQSQLAAAFREEAEALSRQHGEAVHEMERTVKDRQRLESLGTNFQPEFERMAAEGGNAGGSVGSAITDSMTNAELVKRLEGLERSLAAIRSQHGSLDRQRDDVVKDVSAWSRTDRFGKLRSSISYRFIDRAAAAMESHAELDIRQLEDRCFQITAKLQEADKHRDIVVRVLTGAVDEALELLGRISRLSKLPERLPQAGQQFVKIETKASENPIERQAQVGEFIDEQLERGDVGDGLELIQKAVRRVARRITVRVLHPDLHHKTERVSMSDMRRFSGGERLTMAILLYCALIRLRRGESNRRGGSSVLILDNPIGTASRVSFLNMQREVARAMNVQLIYATAVKDLNAVGALENVIRLRNTRVDRRTGRHFIEVEEDAKGEISAARIAFDAAPGSQLGSNGQAHNGAGDALKSKAAEDV